MSFRRARLGLKRRARRNYLLSEAKNLVQANSRTMQVVQDFSSLNAQLPPRSSK
jgi:hypothetical protein